MSTSEHPRRVLIVTGSRGEYGYLRPIIKLCESTGRLRHSVVATNMHLLPDFGNSIREFSEDGIHVDNRIYMALSGYTNVTMVKSLGVFMLSFADLLDRQAPDFVLLAGDRGEQLVAAMAAAHLNIPVAHIQAGERSGNIDGMARHAIARFSHIHFAANEDAYDRLVRSGEQEFRVFNVGAPQLDEFLQAKFATPDEIAGRYNLDLRQPVLLLVQHSTTEQSSRAADHMRITLEAVIQSGLQTVVIYPNNDAGSSLIQSVIQQHRSSRVRTERNVSREIYGGLLNVASVIVGNSSSALIEAPSFRLPAVNIGRRQTGRFQAKNVIDVPEHCAASIRTAIDKALDPAFRESLAGLQNPYGDGRSSERIVDILSSVKIDERLLYKQLAY